MTGFDQQAIFLITATFLTLETVQRNGYGVRDAHFERNRQTQPEFRCVECGHSNHAHHNTAGNIARGLL
jgi:hypothetical protein